MGERAMAAKDKYADLNGHCLMHGKVKYLKSEIAQAELCEECITNGYFRDDIVAEARKKYPESFGSSSTKQTK
jgi:hypothetical protein